MVVRLAARCRSRQRKGDASGLKDLAGAAGERCAEERPLALVDDLDLLHAVETGEDIGPFGCELARREPAASRTDFLISRRAAALLAQADPQARHSAVARSSYRHGSASVGDAGNDPG